VRKIAVYGTGGHGREIAALVRNGPTFGDECALVGFIDDNPENVGLRINGADVFSLERLKAQCPDAQVVCAVGSPALREKLARKCADHGLAFATIVAAATAPSSLVEIGEGSVLCAGAIVTVNIRIGRHVHVNIGCTISHDVTIGDFANINPGAHINGWVSVGRRAYVGAGATIINGSPGAPLTIGEDSVIGAGACVIRPVAPGSTVVGVPARPFVRRSPG
jgi:sugar O-acyltransferase (sialic acid O-acetyltransferase NeuD family)